MTLPTAELGKPPGFEGLGLGWASKVWFAADAATQQLVIQRYGVDEAVELELAFVRAHQEAHFVEGCRKLELTGQPDYVKAAAYHALSNALGGIEMGYRHDESAGRAWIFYFPPNAYQPNPATPHVPLEVAKVPFRAWHANNGVMLGNERLVFTLTDLVAAGGPFDAGYFSEADGPVAPDARVRLRLDSESALPGAPPSLSEDTWPVARRRGAFLNFSVGYALGRLPRIAQRHGLADAIAIGEAAHRIVLTSWARPLAVAEGLMGEPGPRRVAEVLRYSFGLLGDEFEAVEPGGDGDVELRHVRSRMRIPHAEGWDPLPPQLWEAWARAWTVVARTLGTAVQVDVVAYPDPDVVAIWSFRER